MESVEPQPHCDIHLPIGETLAPSGDGVTFSLEKAVCSHGLFMMAPNHWDPLSTSLLRPLRLSSDAADAQSVLVRVSQPSPLSLLVRVLGVRDLSDPQHAAVTAQVRRMLRLSESEERKVRAFQSLHSRAKSGGFGRVFRSPTLLEDMVKCILLCNCQWPRTLSMAKALCQLQLELQNGSSVPPVAGIDTDSKKTTSHKEQFCPKTPAGKESAKIRKPSKIRKLLLFKEEPCQIGEQESDVSSKDHLANCNNLSDKRMPREENNIFEHSICYELSDGKCEPYSDGAEQFPQSLGNFPSPEEIASLDEKYLAKRCGLGYRAGRILKLAQSVVDGTIQLKDLEGLCSETNSSSYYELDQKLKEINGFGPFTRGNVLMCMGFYNVIPTDSETIRHLKQVHGVVRTSQTVQKVVEEIYGSFEPFQFLAYWLEVWNFYEEWFGTLSKMPSSQYGQITASKMKAKRKHGVKV